MDSPSVSVVTPSYNQAAYIEDTIRSVAAQTYPNIEHVVVDGDSTDGTQSVLERYDDEITWISKPDEGQVDAISKGFEMASGDVLTWLNSDDMYATAGAVEHVARAFEAGADAVYGDLVYVTSNLEFVKVYCPPQFDFSAFKAGRISMPPQPSTFFAAEVFETEPLDEGLSYVFDYEHWLRVGDSVDARYVGAPIAGFRFHEDSKTVSKPGAFDKEREVVERRHSLSQTGASPVATVAKLLTSTAPRRVDALAKFRQLKADRQRLTLPEEIGFAPWSTVCWRTLTDGLL